MKNTFTIAVLLSALAGPVPCRAAATAADAASGSTAEHILAIHNRERAAVGVPPLVWDPTLATAAASYGPALAALGRLTHSPRESRPGQRENLAMGSVGHFGVGDLVGFWVEEKQHFQPGTFPDVSRTGDWKDVAHYTQMIWKSTTNVGCAIQPAGDRQYLICRYTPPGNADGRLVP